MFCPLCQSEFREGFTECNECHVGLVPLIAEANAAFVRLWTGAKQSTLDQILAALADREIKSHYKELVHAAPKLDILGYALGSTQPTFEYEVYVLRADLENANQAVQNIRKF